MDMLLYCLARAAIAFLQALPLRLVARLGRAAGALAYTLDARHRRAALNNLNLCFGAEMSRAEIRALAKENFRRLGENYCCAVKTAAMSPAELKPHVEFAGAEKILAHPTGAGPRSRIVAIGHFGNFELYARFGQARWQIEAGDEIPTREKGQPRSIEAIMRDVNHAFETAIRRDPANWFWVHKRWKADKSRAQSPEFGASTPGTGPNAIGHRTPP